MINLTVLKLNLCFLKHTIITKNWQVKNWEKVFVTHITKNNTEKLNSICNSKSKSKANPIENEQETLTGISEDES